MNLKVYNKDTEMVETIDATAFDAKIHKHRNTREDFTEADIAGFTGVEKPKKAK